MTRAITIIIFAATWAAAFLVGRWRNSRVPTGEELLGLLMRSRTGRVAAMLFWLWIGFHFFTRSFPAP